MLWKPYFGGTSTKRTECFRVFLLSKPYCRDEYDTDGMLCKPHIAGTSWHGTECFGDFLQGRVQHKTDETVWNSLCRPDVLEIFFSGTSTIRTVSVYSGSVGQAMDKWTSGLNRSLPLPYHMNCIFYTDLVIFSCLIWRIFDIKISQIYCPPQYTLFVFFRLMRWPLAWPPRMFLCWRPQRKPGFGRARLASLHSTLAETTLRRRPPPPFNNN